MDERSDEGSHHAVENFSYEVFLSFRGEDVRKNFIDHLHQALEQRGISTFRDDSGLERGSPIQPNLDKAIETSKLSVVTFSRTYAASHWCLDELVKIMERRESHGHTVLPVFYGVDPTDVRNQSGAYKKAFDEHKVGCRNKVKRWEVALKSVADLAGFCLQNQANGYEAQFIEHIILEVVRKLDTRQLSIPKYMVGTESLVQKISKWLHNGSSETEVGIIYGLGGVGKSTTAKVVYNSNHGRFDASSFLAGISSASRNNNDFIHLQEQLIFNISGNAGKIYNVHEGREKIRKAIGTKKVLVVLDDVDEVKQLNSMFDYPKWFLRGSKILITTRNQHLIHWNSASTVEFPAIVLNVENSTKLFYHHAFSNGDPPRDYREMSALFINYCEGLPLALEVLACSLYEKSLAMWADQFAKLKNFPDQTVHNVLELSFKSLNDRNNEDIFLHIAFFMVGMKKDLALTILEGCGLHGVIGLKNLTDKCLVSIDTVNDTLVMHHLIQQMAFEVVRQQEPVKLGDRSRLLGHTDAKDVLWNNLGTGSVRGLHLGFPDPNDDFSAEATYVEHSINHIPKTFNFANPFQIPSHTSSVLICSFYFLMFFIFSFWAVFLLLYLSHYTPFPILLSIHLLFICFTLTLSSFLKNRATTQTRGSFPDGGSKLKLIKTSAFSKMCYLDILLLENVQIEGDFEHFPKMIKCLSWRGFPLKSIPSEFELGKLVVLDMQRSCLVHAWEGTRRQSMCALKVLNLGHSHQLESTPDLSSAANLEQIYMKGCGKLIELHESIGSLGKLTHLNLEDCSTLEKMPDSVKYLTKLTVLNLKGCRSLRRFPINKLGSLERLNLNDCKSFFKAPDPIELSVICSGSPGTLHPHEENLSTDSLPQQCRSPLISHQCSFCLPNLKELHLARCCISGDSVLEWLCCARSLQYLDLWGNPIRVLNNEHMSAFPLLELIRLAKCTELRSVSQSAHRPSMTLNLCSSLKRIAYNYEPGPLLHETTVHECDELVDIDYEGNNIQLFEWTRDMDKGQATSLGFPNLDTFDTEKNSSFPNRSLCYGRGKYQGGTYQVYLPGDHLAKWFSTIETTEAVDYFYYVPLHPLPIRAFNIGFMVSAGHEELRVYSVTFKNLTSPWEWTLRSLGYWQSKENSETKVTWLSHWFVKKHREVKPGDRLLISVRLKGRNQTLKWGIRILYEEQQVDEDESEQYRTVSDEDKTILFDDTIKT